MPYSIVGGKRKFDKTITKSNKRQKRGMSATPSGRPIGAPTGNMTIVRAEYGPEMKFKDVQTNQAATTTGATQLLNGILQGVDVQQRVGRKCVIKQIYLRGKVTLGGTPTTSSARILLVYDKQPNNAALTPTDVLAAVGANTATVSANQLNNRDRFVTVWDKVKTVNVAGTAEVFWKCFKKVNLPTIYSGTDDQIGSIASGALWLLIVGDIAAGATCPLTYTNVRIRFLDD